MSSALPTELWGHASISLLKGRSIVRTAPLLTNLHRGAFAAPSQSELDLLLREDCSHQEGGGSSRLHCDGAAMAPLCNFVKIGCEQMTYPWVTIWKRGPIAHLVEHLTYKIRGREFESLLGRLFSCTVTFRFF